MLEYRNELKFICSQCELEILKARLSAIMETDPHQAGGSYRVRSLYFDDQDDSAFFGNESGVDNRRKFRIRVYDDPLEPVMLEIKYKRNNMTRKESCRIDKSICNALLEGQPPVYGGGMSGPLRQFYLHTMLYCLRPAIIIEYERTAYIYAAGNVRITFDRNIAWSGKPSDFFSERINLIPMLPQGMHVLEVKYDEFLPDYIAQALELGNLQRTSFSKYCLGRLCEKGEAYEGQIT